MGKDHLLAIRSLSSAHLLRSKTRQKPTHKGHSNMKRLMIALILLSMSGCSTARFVVQDTDITTGIKGGVIRSYLGRRSEKSNRTAREQMSAYCSPLSVNTYKNQIIDEYFYVWFFCQPKETK